jgi:hypothetical protein
MNLWRITALIVLLNIGAGMCACMADAVLPEPAASTFSAGNNDGPAKPDCGSNCDSCICCAAMTVCQTPFEEIELSRSGVTIPPLRSLANPYPALMDRPPRF